MLVLAAPILVAVVFSDYDVWPILYCMPCLYLPHSRRWSITYRPGAALDRAEARFGIGTLCGMRSLVVSYADLTDGVRCVLFGAGGARGARGRVSEIRSWLQVYQRCKIHPVRYIVHV